MVKTTNNNSPHPFRKAQASIHNAVDRRLHKKHYLQFDQSQYDTIFHDGIMSVRHYQQLTDQQIRIEDRWIPVNPQQYARPLVLIPPLGVYSWIFDLMIERSLVRYLLAQGFDVYLIDWGSPKEKDAHLTLGNYVLNWFPQALQAIRQDSQSEDISLMGYCMGGLLALIYLATHNDQQVINLVTIAAPVDARQSGAPGKLSQITKAPITALSKLTSFRLNKLHRRYFHIPGEWLSVAFKLSNPIGALSSYIQLLKHLDDEHYVSNYVTMHEWFTHMPDYPGGMVRDMIQKFGLHNDLARDRLIIDGAQANFERVKCSLLALAGDHDKIVSVESARAILDLITSTDKTFTVVPGGHAGIFAGSHAANHCWAIASQWLAQRSS